MKVTKKKIVRFRVEESWKCDFEAFARSTRLDMSDVARIACDEMMKRHASNRSILASNATGH